MKSANTEAMLEQCCNLTISGLMPYNQVLCHQKKKSTDSEVCLTYVLLTFLKDNVVVSMCVQEGKGPKSFLNVLEYVLLTFLKGNVVVSMCVQEEKRAKEFLKRVGPICS